MMHLGLLSIAWIWCGLLFLIWKWKGNVSMTFSQHAAQTRAAQLYYLSIFAIELPLFTLFMFKWFIPTYGMSWWFGFFLIIGTLGQSIAVLVPETIGKKVVIHRVAAFAMADCLVPLALIIALSTQFSGATRYIAGLVALYQILGIIMLAPKKGYHPRVLPLQASYIFAFHVAILSATYLG